MGLISLKNGTELHFDGDELKNTQEIVKMGGISHYGFRCFIQERPGFSGKRLLQVRTEDILFIEYNYKKS